MIFGGSHGGSSRAWKALLATLEKQPDTKKGWIQNPTKKYFG